MSNPYELRMEMLKRADEFLWNKFIHDKNKWDTDNQGKDFPDNDSYPQPPDADSLIRLADRYRDFVTDKGEDSS